MKFIAALGSLLLAASTASAYLDGCRCVDLSATPIWKNDIKAFINEYQARGPNEFKVPGGEWTYRIIDAETSPVMVAMASIDDTPVTFTKAAMVDLLWELNAKRESMWCQNAGQGISCSRASRGTPQVKIEMVHERQSS